MTNVNKQKRVRVRGTNNLSTETMHEVCGLTDPFCEHALGAKGFTVSPQQTLAFQARQVFQIATGAGTYAGFMFNGGAYQEMVRTFSPGTPTVTGGSTGNIVPAVVSSAVSAYGSDAWRINSVGVRWWDVGAATDVGGHVIASVLSDPYSYVGVNWTMSAPIPGSQFQITDRRDGGAVILYPVDERADQFHHLQTATAYAAQDAADQFPLFQGLYLAASGDASKVIINVEIVINFEIIVNPGLAVGLASTPHFSNPYVNKLVEYVRNQGKTFYNNNKDQINNMIKGLIRQGAKKGLNYMLPGSGTLLLTNG